MGVEIERKFLVRSDAWRVEVTRGEAPEQGYPPQTVDSGGGFPGYPVRVRRAGDMIHPNINSRVGRH